MRLTPLDIQQQQFRTTLWGFDKKEVDAFLDVVAADLERQVREAHQLRESLAQKEHEILEHRERERTIKDTMLNATRVSEDIKQNARKEAEIIVAEAEVRAERIVGAAEDRLARLRDDLEDLRRQKVQFEASLRSMLASHQQLLDTLAEAVPEGDPLPGAMRRRRRPQESPAEPSPAAALSPQPALAVASEVASTEARTPARVEG
jgi:cell division initiation protein